MARTSVSTSIGYMLVLLPGIVLGFSTDWDAWIQWRHEHGKTYTSLDEEHSHMITWLDNYKLVTDHNSRTDVGYKLHINHLADQVVKASSSADVDVLPESTVPGVIDELVFAPVSWDWRGKGAITTVQNQGLYADSQAIVATECVESYHVIQAGQVTSLSQLEVQDCCTNSSLATNSVLQCIHNIGGLCSESSYPKLQHSCKNNTCSPVAKINGGMRVPAGDEVAMVTAVYKTPVMAVIDASDITFQLYQEGIYNQPNCSTIKLDHALQVVGYGTEAGLDYWICKNSWGVGWGEKGYIRIARNKGNMCGIASMTTYPV